MEGQKSKKPAKSKSAAAESADSPDFELARREALSALAWRLADLRFSRLHALFARLYLNSPQVLLFEGGSVGERIGAALYFAAGLNCERIAESAPGVEKASQPCLECETCRLMLSGGHRDLFILDGRTESIKIDDVRALRPVLGEAPHSARKRVVILAEAHFLMEAAANSLLKSLEEPRAGTVFILCTPQRQRLLPTLVSRSWVLTLPWPHPHYDLAGLPSPFSTGLDAGSPDSPGSFGSASPEEQQLKVWEQALMKLLQPESAQAHAVNWMSLSAQKGSLDKHLALNFITHCRRALCAAVAFGRALPQAEAQGQALEVLGIKLRKLPALSRLFAGLSSSVQWEMSALLDEADEALLYTINPSLVLDRMAVRLFLLSR